ncbi:MAG: glutathione S-transferase family protein [Xenococcaceae cyanobacterium]
MTIKLFAHELSGNCYKVKLLLSLLGLEHEIVNVDLMKGEHKSPEFLKINPFSQVPVLVDKERVFQDSQAILVYLAQKYGDENWLPNDAESLSRIVRWLSITAGEISQGLALARRFYLLNDTKIDIEIATQKSTFILQQIERHLADREWLELERTTIADIAVFPYVALAPDGKIALDIYPHIQAWIDRLKKLSGFVSMGGL